MKNRMPVKQLITYMILVSLWGCIVIFLSGCQKSQHFQTAFPLDEDEVIRFLEQVGLPGEISKDETELRQDGCISYVIRDPSETYGDSGNSKMIANVVSLSHKKGRALSTVFNQSVASETLVWSDWEQQIKYATLLYGGFEDEEALFKICKEIAIPTDTPSFRWETELSEGYCRVYYIPRKNKAYDENDCEVVTYSATMWVDIYESKEIYDEMKTD